MTLAQQAVARLLDRGWHDKGEGVYEHPTTEVQMEIREGLGGCVRVRERMHQYANWGGFSSSWTLDSVMRLQRKANFDGLARPHMAGREA